MSLRHRCSTQGARSHISRSLNRRLSDNRSDPDSNHIFRRREVFSRSRWVYGLSQFKEIHASGNNLTGVKHSARYEIYRIGSPDRSCRVVKPVTNPVVIVRVGWNIIIIVNDHLDPISRRTEQCDRSRPGAAVAIHRYRPCIENVSRNRSQSDFSFLFRSHLPCGPDEICLGKEVQLGEGQSNERDQHHRDHQFNEGEPSTVSPSSRG